MISVLIITKNEELNLLTCIESVSWSDDIHVFDSFSSDNTVLIALAAGASVTQRHFDGYASQRNAAIHNINYKYEWLLILDADERIPVKSVLSIKEILKNVPDETSGFRLRRRDYIYDKWLKRAQISPFFIRLIRTGKACYHREINEVLLVDGNVTDLEVYFDHYPFSKGISFWLTKHNLYSSMEAERGVEEREDKTPFSLRKALFSKDFSERRYNQKGLFNRLPCRPIIKWVFMMLVRGAFFDGSAGVTYANLQSIYEYLIIIKRDEIFRHRKK